MRVAIAAVALLLLTAGATPVFAQTSASGDFFRSLDTGRLAVILIFGMPFVGALGWAVSAVIHALRDDVASADEINERIASLEQRLAAIEQQTADPAARRA